MLWRILKAWWRSGRTNKRIASYASLQVATLEERCMPTNLPGLETAAIVQVASVNPTEPGRPLVRTDLFCSGAPTDVETELDDEESWVFSSSMLNLATSSSDAIVWENLEPADDVSFIGESLAA